MQKKIGKKLLIFLIFGLTFLALGIINRKVQSASLTSVSDTISNARPSFRGALGTGTAGTIAIINVTPGAYPSTSSAQLVEGDVLRIGDSNQLVEYTVASTSGNNTIYTTAALAATEGDAGDVVIASTSATHTVRFTTASAVANGRFRVLVPALASDTASNDGIPDGGYFDFGAATPTVTCPTDPAGYDFVTGVATASSITVGSVEYHSYECAYSGAGAVGTAFDGGANGAITIASIINPAPKSSHGLGTADTHNIVIQHLNSSLNIIDTTTVTVGVIEAVKVTANVPPQISFSIMGVASGVSACGVTTDVTTTATSVPFGELSITTFTEAAQTLAVSTNAGGGFSVTAIENDQLGRNGVACAGADGSALNNCIPDAEVASMNSTTTQAWATTANKGFGYTLHDYNTTTTEAFAFGSGWRHFADQQGTETAVELFNSNSDVADNQHLYVCYRVIPETTTEAGNYENNIRYTATATF